MGARRYIPVGITLVVMVLLQLLTAATGRGFYLTQLTMSAYYAVVVIGLCMVMGYAGQISIGHAGFFAIGGYSTAVLTTLNLADRLEAPLPALLHRCGLLVSTTNLYGQETVHVSPYLAAVAAVAITIVVAYGVGGPVLRLKGHYLAMATLGFGSIIYHVVMATRVFGESDGISGVPPFRLLPGLAVNGRLADRLANYYIACGLVLVGLIILVNLTHSRVGRALRAIHGAPDAAEAMGVNTARYKLNAFVISAVFAAVAGVFLTHYNGSIGPSEASILKSVRYVAIVAVGGMANLWGVLIMALLLNFLSLRGYFGSYDDAVFGLILIGIMLFAPQGLIRRDLFRRIPGLRRLSRRAATATDPSE